MISPPSIPLHQLGENALLKEILISPPSHEHLLVGPGDDCAVVRGDHEWDILLKTDVVVEGVHFERGCDAALVGRKALARALSDIAAMGGIAEHALVTLLIHPSRELSYVKRLYSEGFYPLAAQYGCSLAGGETSALPTDGLIINICLTGRVERGRAVLRSGAQLGDILCVSGQLGGSFASGRHLSFEPRVELARALMDRHLEPSAMMDLSDGLAVDLKRLCDASGLAAKLKLSALPCHKDCSTQEALSDGEDYELLMCFSPERWIQIQASPLKPLISAIGEMIAMEDSELTHRNDSSCLQGGWTHFKQS